MLVTHLVSPRDYISELYFHDLAGPNPPSSTPTSNFCCPVAPVPISLRHLLFLKVHCQILIYNFF
jgi:hypothetical protein